MNIKFMSKRDLDALCAQAKAKADAESNQDSYNAAWLHGYASALADIAKAFDAEAIAQAYEQTNLFEDAAAQLAKFFDIDPEENDDDVSPEWMRCTDTMGASYDELTNPGNDAYVLDKLVSIYMRKSNRAEDEKRWNTAICEYIYQLKEQNMATEDVNPFVRVYDDDADRITVIHFRELRKGMRTLGNDGTPCITVGVDAHVSQDESCSCWIVYDKDGNSYFPEDFVPKM